jgi:hypothetical protein
MYSTAFRPAANPSTEAQSATSWIWRTLPLVFDFQWIADLIINNTPAGPPPQGKLTSAGFVF